MTLVSDRKIPFFTPVVSEAYPLMKVVDSYFWFGGRVAEVVLPEQIVDGSTVVKPVNEAKTSMMATVFKIASMILSLGILPLLAIAVKMIKRCSHSFHWIDSREVL